MLKRLEMPTSSGRNTLALLSLKSDTFMEHDKLDSTQMKQAKKNH
jgi:hypothetical protein